MCRSGTNPRFRPKGSRSPDAASCGGGCCWPPSVCWQPNGSSTAAASARRLLTGPSACENPWNQGQLAWAARLPVLRTPPFLRNAAMPSPANSQAVPESFDPSVFRQGYRASGVLLHLTSLPSAHGIGDFGPAAEAWIDALQRAGQRWWQILPIGPPDRGNSPYTPLSTFACNPLLISLERLVDDGLLSPEDLDGA